MTSSADYIIVTDNICKQYKDFKALDKVNIHIERGTIYGVIGKNGAGKTTLLKIISGMLKQSEGQVKIQYKNNKLIGTLIEEPGLFYDMTAIENLKVKAFAVGIEDNKQLYEILNLVGLSSYPKVKAKNYSLGMKQRLGIALALVGNPDIIILDEPINGLDPQGIAEIRKLILDLKNNYSKTIVISSHILEELFKIGDKYAIIDKSNLLLEDSKQGLQNRLGKYVQIESQNIKKVSEILEYLNIKEYDILEGKIIIKNKNVNIWDINKKLVERNVEIEGIGYVETSYEELFFKLVRKNYE